MSNHTFRPISDEDPRTIEDFRRDDGSFDVAGIPALIATEAGAPEWVVGLAVVLAMAVEANVGKITTAVHAEFVSDVILEAVAKVNHVPQAADLSEEELLELTASPLEKLLRAMAESVPGDESDGVTLEGEYEEVV